jgi:hypothetical protein
LWDLPADEFLKACAERKKLHLATSKIWNARGFAKKSDSVYIGPVDPVKRCPRCGSTFFTRDDNGQLRCHDCHLHLQFEFEHDEADDEAVEEITTALERVFERDPISKKAYDPNAARERRSLTPEEFVSALVASGRMKKIHKPGNFDKNLGSFRILVLGHLPLDVVADTGEKPTTIKSRADDLFEAIQKAGTAWKTAADEKAISMLRKLMKNKLDMIAA